MKFKTAILFVFLIFSAVVLGQNQNSDDKPFYKTPEMIYSFGQKYNSWSANIGFGPVFMYADQSGYQIFPNQKIDFGPSVWVTKHLVPAFAFETQFLQSKMHGEEGSYAFEGDFLDFSVNGIAIINQMSSKPGPINDKWNYYLKIGIGTTMFRSRLLHRDTDEVVRRNEIYDSSRSNFVVQGYDESDAGKKVAREAELVMPFGLGLMYRINRSFDVGLESVLRFSASDKLDNILTGASNDRYLFTALNVSYKFGDKNRRHERWTYRTEEMDLLGRTVKDQLEHEIKKLEEDILEYEANRPVHKDSVVITQNLRIIYEQYNVRTIFFSSGSFKGFSPADQLLLGRVAIDLQNHSQKKVRLYGYSDSVGDADQNMELSRKRCQSVKDFLVNNLEINPGRIDLIPRGEEDPLSPVEELTPRGLQMVNRRVDIVVE